MPIIMMTNEANASLPNVVTVRDYYGHEEGLVRHDCKCPHFERTKVKGGHEIRLEGLFDDCLKGSYSEGRCDGPFKPLYMMTTHVGLVIETGEYNGYDDSDFYAVVWDVENQRTQRIVYATTRGWTYPNSATIDATPEVLAQYNAWCERMRAKARAEREAVEAATPRKGKVLKVVKGRKVPIDTQGVCVWFGMGEYGERVGIKDAKGVVHWTAATNVIVVAQDVDSQEMR